MGSGSQGSDVIVVGGAARGRRPPSCGRKTAIACCAYAGTLPVPELVSPENVQRIVSAAKAPVA